MSSDAWHARELQAGKQALPGMAAALRLARVRALTLLGRLDDAAAVLQRLQGAKRLESLPSHQLQSCKGIRGSTASVCNAPR